MAYMVNTGEDRRKKKDEGVAPGTASSLYMVDLPKTNRVPQRSVQSEPSALQQNWAAGRTRPSSRNGFTDPEQEAAFREYQRVANLDVEAYKEELRQKQTALATAQKSAAPQSSRSWERQGGLRDTEETRRLRGEIDDITRDLERRQSMDEYQRREQVKDMDLDAAKARAGYLQDILDTATSPVKRAWALRSAGGGNRADMQRRITDARENEDAYREELRQLQADIALADGYQYEQKGAQELGALDAGTYAAIDTLAQEKRRTGQDEQGHRLRQTEAQPEDDAPADTGEIYRELLAAGMDKADIERLVDHRVRQIDRETYEAMEGRLQEAAHDRPVLTSLGSVAANVFSGAGYMEAAAEHYLGHPERPVNYYNPGMQVSGAVDTIRGTVAQDIGSPAGSFLYQTGMSMADSAANMLLTAAGIPQQVGLSIMATGAASNALREAHKRGLSDDQALGLGLVSGAAEYFTERIGLDAFMETIMGGGRGGKAALRELLRNTLAEGGEEVASDVINLIADEMISGDQSQLRQNVEHYREMGYEDSEAVGLAVKDQLKDTGLSFLGGALSGGTMGGVGLGINRLQENAYYKGTYGADSGALVEEALELDPENRTALEAQERLQQGKQLSGGTLRQLVEQNEAQIRRGAGVAEESTAVNDDPAEHTPEEQAEIEAYKNAVDPNLVEFYRRAKTENVAKKGAPQFEMHPVTEQAAEDIRRITGVDTTGFRTLFDTKQANHIHLDHGEDGRADQSMADDNDVGRLQYVLDHYDSAEDAGSTSAYTEQKADGRSHPVKAVRFSKKVNGTYFVVEAVPNTKAKAVYVVSAYMLEEGKRPYGRAAKQKGVDQQSSDAFEPQSHGQTGTVETTPAFTIPPSNNDVKSGKGEAGRRIYEAVRQMAPAGMSEAEIRGYFEVGYEIGRETAAQPEEQGLALAQRSLEGSGFTPEMVESAYYAGREDLRYEEQKGDRNNGTAAEESVRVRGDEERSDGADPGGAGSRVAEDAGAAGERAGDAGGPADRGAAGLRLASKARSSAQLIGATRGSGTDRLRLVTGGDSAAVQKARAQAKARGLTAYFVTGDYMHVDGAKCRGYIRGNSAYIRADDPRYTADQIMRHESGHDAVAKGEIDPAEVLEQLERRYGEGSLDAIMDWYARQYADSGMSADEIWEELLCDSLGDMNVFAEDLSAVAPELDRVLKGVKDAALEHAMERRGAGHEKTAPEGGRMKFSRVLTFGGKDVVYIENSGLTNKQCDDFSAVEDLIASHIGEVYRIAESGQSVYIGKDTPGEYVYSDYSTTIRKNIKAKWRAKARAAGSVGLLIETATNRKWEKTKHTHNKDAKFGFYRYKASFAIPVSDNRGRITGIHAYNADLLIRNASDGKKYLYDIVGIKENTAIVNDLLKRQTGLAAYAAARGSASNNSISNSNGKSNPQNSDGKTSRVVEAGDLKPLIETTKRSEREILAQALADGAAASPMEREWLSQYKKHAEELDRIQEKLNEQSSLIHGHETGEAPLSRDNLQKAINRADVYRKQLDREDGALTRIKAMEPIRNLLERQRAQNERTVTEAERAARLAKVQAEALKERAAYWERQTKVTELPTMRKEDVRKLVNGTIRDFRGKIKADEVLEIVQRAADALAVNRNSEANLQNARNILRPAARRIVESALANANEETEAEGREIREHLRSTAMELTPELAEQMPEWSQWRRKYGARIRMKEGGTPVDVAYEELTERFGAAWFPADIVNPADQLLRIGEVLDRTATREENPFAGDLDAAAESCLDALTSGLVDESMRLTAPTVADRWAARLEKATREARESREEALRRAREGREDTARRRAERMRIAVMVRALDRQLRNPTDGRHIPDALRPTVLELCGIFTGNRIDSVQQGQRVTVDDHAIFSEDALERARHAYEELRQNEEGLGELYDEQVAESLQQLEKTVTGRRLSELSYEELQDVRRIVDHVRFLAQTVNEIFINGRKLQIDTVARGFISNAAMKGSKWTMAGSGTWGDAAARMLVTGNLKPEYFFRSLEDDTMSDLWNDMMAGQSTYGLHMREAREFKDDLMKRLDVKKWMDGKKVLAIRDAAGHPMELTMQQAMSLLAAYKREQTNHATNHVLGGGFVFRDGVSREKAVRGRKVPLLKEYKADSSPHTMTEDIIREVALWLEKQDERSMEYVDEMVRYLSRDMAALGNETSMRLHGYRKFGERYYFPMQSVKAFLDQQFDKVGEANRNFRNKGFTKRTVEDANNPFVLRDFDEVWAEHVNQMLMYNALAVPQDNWNRVMNYRTGVDTEGHSPNNSVRAQFAETYGERAMQYFDTLMKDINGGITTDPRAGTVNRLISMWKKSAVFASMSVAIQQPSAIARAMAVMDPKYLAKTTLSRRDFRELQKWSGVAVIKSIGGFDTATGRTGAEWLLDDQGLREKIEVAMTVLPEKMDEITWAHLWNAVKAEIADTESFQVGSDEYFQRCAERFEEVVERTQVYDSVMTRSENMRSKDSAVKMMTAFMAEPTVTLNMAMDAIANVRKHNTAENRRAMARTVLVLLASVLFNNALKAIVTAPRDKDKDKTYAEKYVTKFVGGVKDDVNPLNYFPVLKDVMELVEGYTVEASWTTVPKELIKAIEEMKEDPTVDSGVDLAAAVSSLFGLPVKNLVRDFRSIWNTAANMLPLDETDRRGLRQAFEDGVGIDRSLKKYLGEAWDADRKGNEAARKRALNELRLQYDDKVQHFLHEGRSREEAEKKARESMLSAVTAYLKPMYQAAQTTAEKQRIKSLALRIYIGNHQLYSGYNWKNWEK